MRRVLVVNFDAHFDLRVAAQANLGTPFRQIQEWCAGHGRPFDYRVFGISRYANTQALFERADVLGARYWLDAALQGEAGVQETLAALEHDLSQCHGVYLTVDMDVLPGAAAPGVSAPAPLGVPLAFVERLVDACWPSASWWRPTSPNSTRRSIAMGSRPKWPRVSRRASRGAAPGERGVPAYTLSLAASPPPLPCKPC